MHVGSHGRDVLGTDLGAGNLCVCAVEYVASVSTV